MIKKYSLSVVIVLCGYFPTLVYASPNPVKQLGYQVKYLKVLPVGMATMQLNANIHELNLKPNKLIYFFTNLKATLSAQMEPSKVTYTEDIETKIGRPEHKTIVYDKKNDIIDFTRGKFKNIKKKVSSDVLDPFSIIKSIASTSFEKGKKLTHILNTNQSNYVLDSVVEGHFPLKTAPLGQIKAWKVHTTIKREDKLDRKPKMTLNFWFYEHQGNVIPVFIQAKTLLGPFELVLKSL